MFQLHTNLGLFSKKALFQFNSGNHCKQACIKHFSHAVHAKTVLQTRREQPVSDPIKVQRIHGTLAIYDNYLKSASDTKGFTQNHCKRLTSDAHRKGFLQCLKPF